MNQEDSGANDNPQITGVRRLWRALASMRNPRRSLSGKLMLVILSTTVIALAAAGAALLISDLRESRETWTGDFYTEAAILSLAVQPALSFNDRESAQRNLDALQARASIQSAALYDAGGALFAQYVRPGQLPAPAQVPGLEPGVSIAGGRVELVRPVIQGGERLGTIYLRAHFDVGGRVRAYLSVLAAVLGLGFIAALLASTWLQRVVSRPMESMANAARRIVEKHNYSFRAERTTDDETGVVIDAFNKMLDEVELRSRALENSERALLEADRRKDEFLATLAHELRNPLAPIRNAVRILDSSAADERQRKWGREVIARQVQRMSLLLDDLLDVARITRGQLELRKDYVDLRSVVNVAIETARPLLDAKRHQLVIDLPHDNVRLEADPLRLSQIIGNLLTNAAKYTDPGGRIELTARITNAGLDDAELAISISDNGIGLTAEVMPGLFTMFSQVNSAVDRAEGGLGIGLSLVKGLVVLHGGRVTVHSEGLGRGSVFTVYLPHEVLVPAQVPAVKPEVGAADAGKARRGRLLVVDDNRDAAESLGMVLRLMGYEVLSAFSGAEALEIAAREKPHGAIIDIGMPGMSGHEVARRMRLEAWGRHAVLIALTGWGQETDKHAARAAGFDDHLTKPVDPDEVEQALARHLDDRAPGQTAGSVDSVGRA